jgi:hypothetical protein
VTAPFECSVSLDPSDSGSLAEMNALIRLNFLCGMVIFLFLADRYVNRSLAQIVLHSTQTLSGWNFHRLTIDSLDYRVPCRIWVGLGTMFEPTGLKEHIFVLFNAFRI